MKSHTAAAVLAALMVLPAASSAQSLEVRLTPRAGVMTPDGYFYVEYARFGLGPIEWTEAAIESAPVVGLAVEVDLGGSGLWIRGEVLRTLDGNLNVSHAQAQEPVGVNPPTLARTYYDIPAAVTLGSIDLALPTRLTLPLGIQPYFTAGIGGKRYDFDLAGFGPIEDLDEDIVYPSEGVSFALNAGAGAVVRVGGLSRPDPLVALTFARRSRTLRPPRPGTGLPGGRDRGAAPPSSPHACRAMPHGICQRIPYGVPLRARPTLWSVPDPRA
ncbi:MAG: hypothetical protein P8177_15110 [Gemmatimonadota bacterium]